MNGTDTKMYAVRLIKDCNLHPGDWKKYLKLEEQIILFGGAGIPKNNVL